jgi:endonuclease III
LVAQSGQESRYSLERVVARRRSHSGWRKPERRRVRLIRDRLRSFYGRPRNEPHHAPLDELVLTVLSQNTTDRNRDIAYERLRARFRGWQAVLDAPVEEVEEAIRPGGISRVKSRRIQAMLATIKEQNPGGRGTLDLASLETAPREEAMSFLERLPGVGRKTAACVLLFSFDRPEMPVDTHVYRVGSRLGLIRPKASFEEAHDTLLAVTDPEDVYELHVNMIRHGRRLCAARNPRCRECPLLSMCPYGRERVRSG